MLGSTGKKDPHALLNKAMANAINENTRATTERRAALKARNQAMQSGVAVDGSGETGGRASALYDQEHFK